MGIYQAGDTKISVGANGIYINTIGSNGLLEQSNMQIRGEPVIAAVI